MKDIAFHITDIYQNSVRASATEIGIALRVEDSQLSLRIDDNGCGMDAETLKRATDPFYTTRTTRKVGLGLPFLIQNARQCGGDVHIDSTVGKGTSIEALFRLDNIDCPPVGNLPDTLMLCLGGNPQIDTRIKFEHQQQEFDISTHEIVLALDGIPVSHPSASTLVREILEANLEEVFGDSLTPRCIID